MEGIAFGDDPAFISRLKDKGAPWKPNEKQQLFTDAVRAAELAHRQGIPVSPDTVRQQGIELNAEAVTALFASDKFQRALEDRGIPRYSTSGLSAAQLSALAIYFDFTVARTHAQKLRAAGVSDQIWRGWCRQSEFEAERKMLADLIINDSRELGKLRLAEMVDEGNLKAIEFVFEMTGVHDRRGNPVDVQKLLMTIYTVLDESGVAPEVMKEIAARLRSVLDGGALAPVMTLQPQRLGTGSEA